jgi:hypothetical protein
MGMEKETTPERALGDHERVTLPADAYVMLPQIRDGKHRLLDELVDSICQHGMLQNPIATWMTPEQLADHLEFNNALHGQGVTVEQYAHQQQPNGKYCAVIGGHSRMEAALIMSAREGGDMRRVTSNLIDYDSPETFLAV